jgi:hypothetical protein
MKKRAAAFLFSFRILLGAFPETDVRIGLLPAVDSTADGVAVSADHELSVSYRNTIGASNFLRLSAEGYLRSIPDTLAESGAGELNALFTTSFGNAVAGIELRGSTLWEELGTAQVLGVGAPITLNGDSLSISLTPGFEYSPGSDGYAAADASIQLAMPLADVILKPGAGAGVAFYADDTRSIALSPSVDVSWYPGIPVSGGIWTEYRMLLDGEDFPRNGEASGKVFLAAGLSAHFLLSGSAFYSWGVDGQTGETEIELTITPLPNAERILSIPLGMRCTRSDVSVLSLYAGLRFSF